MAAVCCVEGCESTKHRSVYHPEEDESRPYCSNHTGAAVNHWGGEIREDGEFPTLREYATSDVPTLAKNEDVEAYELIDCPDCHSKAFAHRERGVLVNALGAWKCACRVCEYGSRVLYRKPYYGAAWDRVRRWVKKRDNHTCQDCGQTNVELQVHHKRKLVYFESTKKANQPDNLVTLCKRCHDRRESVDPPKRLTDKDVWELSILQSASDDIV